MTPSSRRPLLRRCANCSSRSGDSSVQSPPRCPLIFPRPWRTWPGSQQLRTRSPLRPINPMLTHRITRWHLRYHVLGGARALAAGVADRHRTRLDDLARGPVAEALAAALDQAFADDPAV